MAGRDDDVDAVADGGEHDEEAQSGDGDPGPAAAYHLVLRRGDVALARAGRAPARRWRTAPAARRRPAGRPPRSPRWRAGRSTSSLLPPFLVPVRAAVRRRGGGPRPSRTAPLS